MAANELSMISATALSVLDRQIPKPAAKGTYDIMSGGLIWADELVTELLVVALGTSSDCDCRSSWQPSFGKLIVVASCDRHTKPRKHGERYEGCHRIAHHWDSGRGRRGEPPNGSATNASPTESKEAAIFPGQAVFEREVKTASEQYERSKLRYDEATERARLNYVKVLEDNLGDLIVKDGPAAEYEKELTRLRSLTFHSPKFEYKNVPVGAQRAACQNDSQG